jgi:hypothetical protein
VFQKRPAQETQQLSNAETGRRFGTVRRSRRCRAVPRYLFNILDHPDRLPDIEGCELPDLEAARRYAIEAARELVAG